MKKTLQQMNEVRCPNGALHVWFEIRKLQEYISLTGTRLGKKGVLIKCANCEKQKKLWED